MKYSLAEHVGADAIRQNEKDKGSGSWLNRELLFNHSLKLNTGLKEKLDLIFEACDISKRKENYRNLDLRPYNRSIS